MFIVIFKNKRKCTWSGKIITSACFQTQGLTMESALFCALSIKGWGEGLLGFGKGYSEEEHRSLERGPRFIQNSRFLVYTMLGTTDMFTSHHQLWPKKSHLPSRTFSWSLRTKRKASPLFLGDCETWGGHMKPPPVMTAHTTRQGQRVPQESCFESKVAKWVY